MTLTLTPEQIARLRQLHWLATKHWSASIGMDALVLRADGSRMVIGDAIYHPEWALDAELIAASRNALPELLDELERLRAEASAGEEYRDILRSERDEARAEVARLQEELTQAQITLLLGRGRADELSSLMRLILSWTEADAYGHRNEDQSGWRERAATARRAAELLESTLHLRDVAEAEAQALRAGLTEALEHYGNLAYSELKPSPYYDREEAKITRLSALLSPAQEQK
jgi:hypothetical protein